MFWTLQKGVRVYTRSMNFLKRENRARTIQVFLPTGFSRGPRAARAPGTFCLFTCLNA